MNYIKNKKISIYWSRRDFRLNDNPALFAAIEYSKKENIDFLPIFILEDYMTQGIAKDNFGFASRFFLTKALPIFSQNFDKFTIIQGKAAVIIKNISEKFDITVFVNEDVHKDFYTQIKKLRNQGVDIKLYTDMLTVSKETVTGSGNMYSVFTPFKNNVWNEFCNSKVLSKTNLSNVKYFNEILNSKDFKIIKNNTEESLEEIFSKEKTFKAGKYTYNIDNLIDKKTLDTKKEYNKWYFDENSAVKHFDNFLKEKINVYKKERDILEINGTSTMSIALAWGLVSARFLKQKIQKHFDQSFENFQYNIDLEGPVHYISELIWREFYKYLLFHKPELLDTEFQERFRQKIEWLDDKTAKYRFEKWIKGETGYPVVDAAMMQLAKTGYMHNRARMIVASILTKNLGVDWRWGQEYFRAMLLDLDESSNNGGWQWGASVGADPKPIRIFNPYLQAENYDKDKIYQKSFLRKDYFENPPEILIEHKKARDEALERYGLSRDKNIFPRDY